VSKRRLLKPIATVTGIAIILAAAIAAWALGLFTPEPDAVTLQDTVAAVAEGAEPEPAVVEPATEAPEPTEPAEPTAADTASELDGIWQVVTGDGTFVGYRADSNAGLAVGRSPGVEGAVTIDGSTVSEVSIVADLAGLESDSRVRDDHLRDDGLETDLFPTSTFVLTDTIELGQVLDPGVATMFNATGDLTVKEITQPVTIELEGTIVGDQLVLVGSTSIALADFDATIGNVTDAVMEFSLVLDK